MPEVENSVEAFGGKNFISALELPPGYFKWPYEWEFPGVYLKLLKSPVWVEADVCIFLRALLKRQACPYFSFHPTGEIVIFQVTAYPPCLSFLLNENLVSQLQFDPSVKR